MGYEYNGARQNYYAFIAAVKGRFGRHGFLTASYTRSSSNDNSANYPEGYVATGGTITISISGTALQRGMFPTVYHWAGVMTFLAYHAMAASCAG